MKLIRFFLSTAFLAALFLTGAKGELTDPLDKDNLVAWCIVPFDAKKRGPEERTQLLVELGLKKCAYDWRAEHVPQFEEEILQYQRHGIEFFAFWGEHDEAFALFEKYGMHPQIWKTNPSPKSGNQSEKVAAAVEKLSPLVNRSKILGSRLGLYNHGGWGGEPENLVAVCKAFHARGDTHVGIVYNFHHGHGHIGHFETTFELMKPYLLCVNLNGMADPETVDEKTALNKILPLGAGKHENAMIDIVINSGYSGPFGILGHIATQDVEKSLRDNLEGLAKLRSN